MDPIQAPITGAESVTGAPAPYLALVQFYRAFNGRDISLMAANWAPSDHIVMDNPLGGIRRGWDAIRPVYERLFRGSAQVYVEFWDYTITSLPTCSMPSAASAAISVPRAPTSPSPFAPLVSSRSSMDSGVRCTIMVPSRIRSSSPNTRSPYSAPNRKLPNRGSSGLALLPLNHEA